MPWDAGIREGCHGWGTRRGRSEEWVSPCIVLRLRVFERDGAMAGELKSENGLGTKVDVDAVRFGANRAAEAQRVKGRLTVRERLGLLLDALEEPTRHGGTAMNGAPN